ncbi:MAG TPA: addiction module protein [Mucilaginibacter sp.]|jgi:hypothetical protein
MSTDAIREKLHNFIDTVDDKKIEAIFSIFEDQLGEPYNWWEDDEFVADLEQRVKDIETGKDKGVTWDEIKMKTKLRRHNK